MVGSQYSEYKTGSETEGEGKRKHWKQLEAKKNGSLDCLVAKRARGQHDWW